MTITPAGTTAASASTAAGVDADAPVVLKDLKLHAGEDYARLRKEGIEHIQRLGHRLWTDYNVHDPGITLLELACYAITDVGYRAGYRILDLLTEEVDGRPVNPAEDRFHTALEILTCHPVTFDDLRKRLVDVPGVRNAWVEPNTAERFAYWVDEEEGTLHQRRPGARVRATRNAPLGGLYDVLIEYEDTVATRQPIQIQPVAPLASAEYIDVGERAERLDVRRPVRFVAVSVWADRPGEVVVTLTKSGRELGSVTHQVDPGSEPGDGGNGKVRLELDFDVPAGTGYRLDCEGSTVQLLRDPRRGAQPAGDAPVRFTAAEWRGSPTRGHNFFYDLEVDYVTEEGDGHPGSLTKQAVRRAVYDRLQLDRNLGEDVVAVRDAATEEIALCADIELVPNADVEEVVARIFAVLRRHVSPRVDFFTIDEMLARGKSVAEIFEGPVLDHGFIDDDQFRAMTRLCEIRVSDVIDLVMDDPDVRSVKKASLLSFVDGELRTQQDWLLTLATDRYRSPVFSAERSKLVMFKDGLPYYPSRSRLLDLLEDTQPTAVHGKLFGHDRDLPVPVGRPRAVDRYHPMQNELPANYFTGPRKVPASLGPLREAQSKQLKAFLMFFEQLLANYLAQLANVGQLFSWDTSALRTYFTQPVAPGEAWASELFSWDDNEAQTTLDGLIESDEDAVERRQQFLDHLIARFAEDFTDYSLLMYANTAGGQGIRLIADKRRFLADYPDISSRRGAGFDYRSPQLDQGSDNLTGLHRRVYGLLGFEEPIRRRFASGAITIVDDGDTFHFEIAAEDDEPRFVSIPCESRESTEALLDLALGLGSDPGNYREAEDGDHVELVSRRGDEVCAVIGTAPADALDAVVDQFRDSSSAIGFHVVEHVLLRPRRTDDPMMPIQLADADAPERVEARDPYTFRATVVLPSWPARFQNVSFRRLVERTLRQEAPAHVLLKICWITHEQMRRFEEAYDRWSLRLADLTRAESRAVRERATGAYHDALTEMIERLGGLVNVYPVARLHDPGATDGDTPAVTLNHTSLGTF